MGREGRWVLVVDDDEGVRLGLSAMISLLGFKVAQASNGLEALTLLTQHGFELILTDLQMPGMDGCKLAFRIKARSPDTPVVLITGSTGEEVKERLKGNCVDCILFKPFRLEEVASAVRFFTGMVHGCMDWEEEGKLLLAQGAQ